MKGWRMEERKAIERLKRGDIGGLEALMRGHQTRAMRAAYLITRDSALAEDIVQSAFVRAYERIGRFDACRPFGPWFTKLVINEAARQAARRERTVSLEEKDGDDDGLASRLADPETGPEGLAEEAEARRKVLEALKELPPAQRTPVVQRYYLGMSEAEAAEVAEGGPSAPGTIRWRLHAARKSLSRILGPWFHAEDAQVS